MGMHAASGLIWGLLKNKRISLKRLTFVFMLNLLSTSALAVESVQVKGLFSKKAAVLLIDGKQSVVKVGKTKDGVTLLSVTSKEVLVEYSGQQHTIGLSNQIGGNYSAPTEKIVRLASQEGGHFWAQGLVNGHSVRFVVDTGASNIAMNLSTAQRLGLDYKSGTQGQVSTANGVVDVSNVLLSKVTIGAITQHNVAASIMLDNSLPVILLGNSFLSGVDMRTESGVLIMKARF